ncbi:hypothetical protein MY4824_006182 [Beauveria thailandica]
MSAAVTASQRSLGWNVNLTTGSQQYPRTFAGLYQNPQEPTVTFADICSELALCFEWPVDEHNDEGNHHINHFNREHSETGGPSRDNTYYGDNLDTGVGAAWKNIVFALTKDPEMAEAGQADYSYWITKEKFDQLVPAPLPVTPRLRKAVTYHIVYHKACLLPADSSLRDHLRARCAQHLPMPKRRRHPAYLPYNKTPSDSRLSIMPLRRKLKASRSQSPPKRTVSGSSTPAKLPEGTDAATDEYADMLAPATMNLDIDEAKRVINDFRAACIDQATCCAVSGDGEAWCPGQRIGPGVQACHIIPQQHYHLYPVERGSTFDSVDVENSTRRHYEAWQHTWSPDNGILLMKHLHDFFDARLFSINPETLRVRVFVPFDAIKMYHGRKVKVTDNVDRHALRHHYEMCCIENMAAKQPNLEITSSGASRMSTSGVNTGIMSDIGTPFSGRTDFPMTPSSGHISTQNSHPMGDPCKNSRKICVSDTFPLEGNQSRKRRRIDGMYGFDSYITPYNTREFLADVNWELRKFKERF